MHEIERTIDELVLHAPQVHRNLALHPLVGAEDRPRDYLLLEEALERGLARVDEVSVGGSVPEIALENLSEWRILLVDGDVLAGARQNRTINLSILVAPGAKLTIPVACVEQGRWSYRTRGFAASGDMLYPRARAEKIRSVSDSMRATGRRHADQRALWEDVAQKVHFSRVDSPSMSLNDAYRAVDGDLADFVAAFRPEPRQRGAVIAIDERIAGVELFDSPDAYARVLPRLVRAYAIDALESERTAAPSASADDARRFLDRIKAAKVERFKAIGEGEDLRIGGGDLAGGALGCDERVIHGAVLALA